MKHKLVPSLVTELNTNIVQVHFNEKTKLLDLGKWAVNLDGLLSYVKPEHYDNVEMFPDWIVQSDDLIYKLIDALKSGSGNILRKRGDWEIDLAKWQTQGVEIEKETEPED